MTDKIETPVYYNTVMPYLILKDMEGFLMFAKKVFGAEEKARHPDESGRILHAEITIGNSTIMACECNDKMIRQNSGLYIIVDSADEYFRKALDAGATVMMSLCNKDFGRICGVMDPSGNTWWIVSKEEIPA